MVKLDEPDATQGGNACKLAYDDASIRTQHIGICTVLYSVMGGTSYQSIDYRGWHTLTIKFVCYVD